MIRRVEYGSPPSGAEAEGSFAPGFLESQVLPPRLVQTVRLLGEYKGKEGLYLKQTPQMLEALRASAIIQSTESSNRLEGVVAQRGRIRQLVEENAAPGNRSEQEIAGYRDVLATIHVRHQHMPFTLGLVRQFHRDLFQFTPSGGGEWKSTDNRITERRPDGTVVVRFEPVPAWRTPSSIEFLHERFGEESARGEIEPLLLLAAYVLDFLCVHPFLDGNGRVARLLTTLLLYRAGYCVGRYVSLEKVVEDTREGYYEALQESSRGWHESRHSLIPWWNYLLGVVLHKAYQEFESRVGVATRQRGAKSELVRDTMERLPARFRVRDIEEALPGVSRPTINRVIAKLKAEGRIRLVAKGREASWEKRK